MTRKSQAEQLAIAWIEGWNQGRPQDIPLSKDFVHTSPFGVIKGRDKYLQQVIPMAAKNVTKLTLLHTLGNEERAAIWFEMATPNSVVQVSEWIQVHDGQICAITTFYDPASLPHKEGYD